MHILKPRQPDVRLSHPRTLRKESRHPQAQKATFISHSRTSRKEGKEQLKSRLRRQYESLKR